MKVIAWCIKQLRFYVVFSKAIFFHLGLLFTYKLVENALFSCLVTFLTDGWDLPTAAIIVNLHEGTYQVLQIFFAYIAHAYSGLFKMLVCSTSFYIIGLLLSYISKSLPEEGFWLIIFWPALVLLSLSHAANEVTIYGFLGDQVLERDPPNTKEEKERAYSRSNFWSFSVSLMAAIVAIFSIIDSFELLSMVSTIAMGFGFLWFLLGTKYYRRVKPPGCPLRYVLFLIYGAITKRGAEYPEQLVEYSGGVVQILPHVPWLRRLNRASVGVKDQEQPGHQKAHTVEQVKGVKFLLRMLPMWTTFITFSLVAATGNTFFLGEVTEVDDEFPVFLFIILRRCTGFVVGQISNYVFGRYSKKKNNIAIMMMLLRIGVGMIFCVLCCIAAWINVAKRDGYPEKNMSIFVLKFVLLGFMKGLAVDGLESFLDSQVSESIGRYSSDFSAFVMGIGKFVSVICIVILRKKRFGWLKEDIKSSRLDKYYALLAFLSTANLILYCLVAYWYGKDTYVSSEDQKRDVEDIVGETELRIKPPDIIIESTPDAPLLQDRDGKDTYVSSEDQERDVEDIVGETELRNEPPDIIIESTPDAPLLQDRVRSFPPHSRSVTYKRFHSMR